MLEPERTLQHSGDAELQMQIDENQNMERAQSAHGRKVTFMIDDELVPPDQYSFEYVQDSMLIEDNLNDRLSSDDLLKDTEPDEDSKHQALFLDDLQQIDEMYSRIEQDIKVLAAREKKQVDEIDAILEAATEQNKDMEIGGLDKIIERDDEGGGDQVDDEDNPLVTESTLAEEVDRICQLKLKLHAMINSYEAKILV